MEVEGRAALALEPRQGHVPRGGLHQGAADRLLHARRPGAAAAPARPPAHPQALSRTAWRASTSTRSSARRTARSGSGARAIPVEPEDDRLLPLRRPPDARLAGQPRRSRAAPVAVARGGDRAADRDGVRPRPRRRRPASPSAARWPCSCARRSRASASSRSRRPRARRGCRCTCRSTAARPTYDDTKPLSQALARHLEAQHPKLIVSTQKKELRRGKVLIDWSQNDEHKTTVSVYSLRARPTPDRVHAGALGRARGGRRAR